MKKQWNYILMFQDVALVFIGEESEPDGFGRQETSILIRHNQTHFLAAIIR
jgi:hypothetical protein